MGWADTTNGKITVGKRVAQLSERVPVIEQVFLHVEIKKGAMQVFSQGTDGYDKVLSRAETLMQMAEDSYDFVHDGRSRRALEL
jgi:hypothetical protein